jgi:murein tripeptide amidase MpaA
VTRSVVGVPVPLLSVTSLDKKKRKRYVVVLARQHPAEVTSSWVMEGVIEFLAGGSEESQALKDKFVFKLLPMVNVDGVIHGNSRCDVTGVDLNRQWPSPSKQLLPVVRNLKKQLVKLAESEDL